MLDDAVWKSAPVLEHFVQSKPLEGMPASRDTEVRVLYDDHALYVGVRCKDDQPSIARLGRRDSLPESDQIWLNIDTQHDKRTAYVFAVNSAGVMADAVTSDGQGTNFDWDGVWDVQTKISADGWTAEFVIPFVTLRFPRVETQSWGFHVRRYISRFNEDDDWYLIRESDATFVGRFEDLDGLVGVKPGLSLQFVPYASATVRASFQDETLSGRDHPQTGSVGFDVKYGLTGSLTLDATVNPDFGQVEVDPEVVNLSAFPVYFPEKRPFFLEGTDIFQSAGSLIYTRRIGAPPSVPTPANDQDHVIAIDPVARIFGAAKLSGNLRPGTAVGVLSAWVDETQALVQNGAGYLGSKSTLAASPMTWFNAARIWQRVGSLSTIGATDTLVIRDGGQTAEVFAADFDARNASDWSASGIVGASSTGICHGGCDPMGGTLSAGRRGGEARAWVDATYFGAELDPNDMGYLAHLVGNQNITETTHTEFFRPVALGPLSRMYADLSWTLAWDPNAGAGLTDNSLKLDGMNRFRNNVELGWFAFHSFERDDDVETRLGSVRLYHRQPRDGLWLRLRSNDLRRFWVEPFNYVDSEGGAPTWNPGLNFTWLGNRVQLGGKLAWTQWFGRPRWVDTFEGRPLFGDLDLKQFEVDLRATAAFSRDWTVQVFTQLLRSASHYEQLRELQDPRTLVASMAPPGSYDGDVTSLIVNAVMRWEFRPGSTFYVVYTHNHQVGTTRGDFRFGSALSDLGSSPADNVLAMKLSYLWAL